MDEAPPSYDASVYASSVLKSADFKLPPAEDEPPGAGDAVAGGADGSVLIITGRGKGSSGNVPLVQEALLRTLRHAEVVEDNRGRIRVDLAQELVDWDEP